MAFRTSSCNDVGFSERISVVVDSSRSLLETAVVDEKLEINYNSLIMIGVNITWSYFHERTTIINPQHCCTIKFIHTGNGYSGIERI